MSARHESTLHVLSHGGWVSPSQAGPPVLCIPSSLPEEANLAKKGIFLMMREGLQVPGSGYGQQAAALSAVVTANPAVQNAPQQRALGQAPAAVWPGPSIQSSSGIQPLPAAAKDLPLKQGATFPCLGLLPPQQSTFHPVWPCPIC